MKDNEVQIPTCLTGSIVTLPPFSFCMDDVRHGLVTMLSGRLETIRIKGSNKKVQDEIEKWADTKTLIPLTVCGYVLSATECTYLSAYSVSSSPDFASKMKSANLL